ncbi:hypothetical protein LUZ60_003602 [Juncus effusus]|nr:hypothetical protein LUZ60_003602 [Juncus effusus]
MSSIQVPYDVSLAIVSLLEAKDVCSLGSCCHFWRDICSNDCVWIKFFKLRWPHANVASPNLATCSDPKNQLSPSEGWKSLYIKTHQILASETSNFINTVYQWAPHESLEVGVYLNAIRALESLRIGFEDVRLFLFGRNLSVLVNLIGLHYCIFRLNVPASEVKTALKNRQVSSREVRVNWSKVGRWSYGFRLRDENCSRRLTLGELTAVKEGPVLALLNRGAVHEVIRVQITRV